MDYGIEHRVALVTGGTRGIGKAVAAKLLAEGCNVVICSRNAEDLAEVTAEFDKSYPGKIFGVKSDLSVEAERKNLITVSQEKFGTIDILVNNAAVVGRTVPADQLEIDEWRELFELNFFSAVELSCAVIAGMKAKKWGRIINISSENGEQPDPNMPHYNATKAAMNNFTKTLAQGYAADNILVNTVAPAFIKTPMAEEVLTGYSKEHGVSFDEGVKMFLKANRPGLVMSRFGTAEEVADAVTFLASERSTFTTGSVLRVDGGSVMSV